MSNLELITRIAKAVAAEHGRVCFVGGYARDTILRQQGLQVVPKDIDLEVYGVSITKLIDILAQYGEVNVVGSSFGVIKLSNTNIDISIPRTDSKVGRGHRGFLVDTNPNMSVREAARRRDFTINSLAIDVLTDEVIDEYGGVADSKARLLRITDPELFVDDPLRVLRAMQLAARFNLRLTEDTFKLCRQVELHDLSAERIGEEWKKLLLLAERPSIGLRIAKTIGILSKLHPDLDILGSVGQEPRWHPEGNVWEHVLLAVDAASKIIRRERLDENQALELMLAVLCHDLGKASTTIKRHGVITSYGHDKAGRSPTLNFLRQLALPQHLQATVPLLVANHMFPILHKEPSDIALRRLAQRLYPATIEQLLRVAEADILGRTATSKDITHLAAIRQQAAALHIVVNKTVPLIWGRDLIELGVPPGQEMGSILKELFNLQLSGVFSERQAGLEQARRLLAKRA